VIFSKFSIAISVALSAIFIWNLAADAAFLQKIGFSGFERGKDVLDFVNANSNYRILPKSEDS